MLYEFLKSNREELIARCRTKVLERRAPRATERELDNGIPVFLRQLTEILRLEDQKSDRSIPAAVLNRSAVGHGDELLAAGFTVDQVVHDYGDLCQAVTELAIEMNVPITNAEFRTLNSCLDNAIADAVGSFSSSRDRVIADANLLSMNERLGFLAHELRNLINTAMLAVNAIKHGNVGIAGSTGAILDRSLKGLEDLCTRALVDVRLNAGIPEQRERIPVSQFIEDAEVSAAFDAQARHLELIVEEVSPELRIDVDRQILAGALANLLQNAFKFTRANGKVSLRSLSHADRILIEVEDECGGLPSGNSEELFRMFEQRGSDRSGLGLGLAISRRGVEANGGNLYVRNLPGKGCVFTIDLPNPIPTLVKQIA